MPEVPDVPGRAESEGDWWFNLRTQAAEHGAGGAGKDRMGPYASREEAERAFQIAKERNRAWREGDDDDD